MCGDDADISRAALVGEAGVACASSDHVRRASRSDSRCGVRCAGAENRGVKGGPKRDSTANKKFVEPRLAIASARRVCAPASAVAGRLAKHRFVKHYHAVVSAWRVCASAERACRAPCVQMLRGRRLASRLV